MTFSVVPFANQNATHNANLFRQAVSSLVPPGGGLVTTGDCAVAQTGTASMAVTLGVGRLWIPGTNVANVPGGNFSSQAMYYAENDSSVTATVATSDPTNPRIDVVYVAIQDSQYSGSTDVVSTTFIATGTPTSGATYPTNAPAIPNNAIALAWIYVGNGVSSILNANITALAVPVIGPGIQPRQSMASLGGSWGARGAGYGNPGWYIDGGRVYLVGCLTNTATVTLNSGSQYIPCTLPAAAYPPNAVDFSISLRDPTFVGGWAVVNTSGQFEIQPASTMTGITSGGITLSLEGISWLI